MESSAPESTLPVTNVEQEDCHFNIIRIVYALDLEDRLWFRAAEIVDILKNDYNDPNAILTSVDPGDKINYSGIRRKFVNIEDRLLEPGSVFVSENGLFSLIDLSKLPTAKSFRTLIIREYLPAVRRVANFDLEKKMELTLAESTFWKSECEKMKHIITLMQCQYQALATDSKGKDVALEQQTNTLNYLRHHVQLLEAENEVKNRTLESTVNEVEIPLQYVQVGQETSSMAENEKLTIQRQVEDLQTANRAKDTEIEWYRNHTGLLKQQIQYVNDVNSTQMAKIEQYRADNERMKQQIQDLDTENRANLALTEKCRIDFETMKRKTQALEAINAANAEKIDQPDPKVENGTSNENEMKTRSSHPDHLQPRINLLKMKNSTKKAMIKQDIKDIIRLKEQVRVLRETEKSFKQTLRDHSIIFDQLRVNFTPMISSRLQERFFIFRLNDESIYTHYVIRAQTRKVFQQIKKLRTRHPNCVEVVCIPYYPNAVNLFNLIKNRLRGTLKFKGNYFSITDKKYTENDLTKALQKLQTDADYLSSLVLGKPKDDQLANSKKSSTSN